MKMHSENIESGNEWLEKIPCGWINSSLKFLLRRKVSDGPHETPVFAEKGFPFLSVDGIQDGELVFENCRYISEEDHHKYKKKCPVERHDILMGKAASIGKIARVKVSFDFSVWSPLAIIKPHPKKLVPAFLEYSLKSSFSQDQIEIYATSNTQKNISMDDIHRIQIVYPPLPEQKTIANFLERKAAQIDNLIAKKQHQIDLLHEQRTALINQAVSKGLNPDAPMKDSGVEWLGKIPRHWDLPQVRYVAKVVRGQTPRPAGDSRFFGGDFIPWITVGEVTKDSEMFLTNTRTMLTEEGSKNSIIFEKGTFILTNSGATLGVPKILGVAGCMNDGVAAFLNISNDISDKFMYFFFMAMTQILKERASISGQPNLNTTIISELYIPKPPIGEQKAIGDYLIEQENYIEETVEKLSCSLELLQEYRMALISAAVIGKIDVREERAMDN